jgi:hypothetical protein
MKPVTNKKEKTIYLLRKGKIRKIYEFDLLINKNTPRGDPPDLYERKPYGGKRLLSDDEFLGETIDGKFKIHDCKMTEERWNIILSLDIPLSDKLFHNGSCYTTYKKPFKKLKY